MFKMCLVLGHMLPQALFPGHFPAVINLSPQTSPNIPKHPQTSPNNPKTSNNKQ